MKTNSRKNTHLFICLFWVFKYYKIMLFLTSLTVFRDRWRSEVVFEEGSVKCRCESHLRFLQFTQRSLDAFMMMSACFSTLPPHRLAAFALGSAFFRPLGGAKKSRLECWSTIFQHLGET
jgi:hypothetical protein